MISLIPWNKVAAGLFVALLLAVGVGGIQAFRLDALKAENKLNLARAEKAEADLKTAQGVVTIKTVTEYVDRVRVVYERGDTIVKEVKVYVPIDSPDQPPGFRVLHDAAVAGELPDPARIADAAPVPAQTAAETIVDNYTTCHATEEQLTALQGWVREQAKLK